MLMNHMCSLLLGHKNISYVMLHVLHYVTLHMSCEREQLYCSNLYPYKY